MTTIDIDAIRKREQAATEGPWKITGDFRSGVDYLPISAPHVKVAEVPFELGDDLNDVAADATFIAHARTDIPALLAELDRLRAVAEAAKVWRQWYGNTNPSYASACNDLAAAVDALTEAEATR